MLSGPGQAPTAQTALIYLMIAALLVVRFAFRELRTRRMKPSSIFILPGVFALLAMWLVVMTYSMAPALTGTLTIAVVAAIVAGIGLGFLVAHFTSVRRDTDGSLLVLGSWITVGIWIGALVLRLLGRFFVMESGQIAETMLLNSAFVVLITAALLAVRFRIVAMGKALGGSTPPAIG